MDSERWDVSHKPRRSLKKRLWSSVPRKRKHAKIKNENMVPPPVAGGNAWISCQADVNKLVKKRRPKKESLFDPDESWPEEETKPIVAIVTEMPAKLTTPTTEEPREFPSEIDDAFSCEINIEDTESFPEEKEKKPDPDEILLAVADAKEVVPALLEEWEIKTQLCRCCLVEGIFDSLHSPAPGDDITYDDMLMQCFNIELFPVSSDVTGALRGVCGLCAARLRDAHAFRHQVSATEARFRDLYTRNCIIVAGTAIAEIPLQPETSDIEDDNRGVLESKIEERAKLSPKKNGNATTLAKPRTKPKKKCISAKKLASTNEFVWTDDAYKCTQCEKSFTLLSDMRKHFRKTHGPNASKCRNRENTMELASTNEFVWTDDAYKCTQCEKSFTLLSDMRKHFRKTHGPNASKCRNRENTMDVPANEYVRTDDGYKCKKCVKSFKKLQSMRIHFRLIHLKQICKLCDNSFQTYEQLRNHQFKEHNIDQRFKCGACDKAYYNKNQLVEHIDVYHMMGQKVKCLFCDYECVQKSRMTKHMLKHKTSKDFHCKYCKKSFLRKDTLQFHERIHTGDKRKVCAECGQAFVQKASLNYHMTKYHPDVKF